MLKRNFFSYVSWHSLPYVVVTLCAMLWLVSAVPTSARALTLSESQINALVGVLASFGVEPATIASIADSLRGGASNPSTQPALPTTPPTNTALNDSSLPTVVQPAENTMSLHASVVSYPANFRKYLYSFPLSGTVALTGLSGSVSTNQTSPNFSEALVSIYASDGACPSNGEAYDSYSDITSRYPLHRIVAYIIKNANGGLAQVNTNFTLPVGIPVSHCVVVILDGSILVTGGAFTMTSDMVMHYSAGTPAIASSVMGLDDEFCFNQPQGCQLASADPGNNSFVNIAQVPTDSTLLALIGDVSDSTFVPGATSFAAPPSGAWSMTNDYYLIRNCASMPRGQFGPTNFYAQLPAGSEQLLSVTQQGSGKGTLQQPVFKTFNNLAVPAGSCLAHVVTMSGAKGGVDAENQVYAVLSPTTPSVPPQEPQQPQEPQLPAANPSIARGAALYVGIQPNCNQGVVSTNAQHLGCATQFIGYTTTSVGQPFTGAPLYVGTQPNCNQGVVSTNPAHLNCSSMPIGYAISAAGQNYTGTPLYLGTQQNCNAGIVSTNARHLGCSGISAGYTLLPQ